MRYYQDRLTRSIYSEHELAELMRRQEIALGELLIRFDELPERQRCLLEEVEAVAGRASRDR